MITEDRTGRTPRQRRRELGRAAALVGVLVPAIALAGVELLRADETRQIAGAAAARPVGDAAGQPVRAGVDQPARPAVPQPVLAEPPRPEGASAQAAATRQAADAESPKTFSPLDLPAWTIVHNPVMPKDQPWIVIVDDPQCPYCMQLLLALDKAREAGDPEISRAVVATIPYPLPYHDQAAHIVADALCLQRSGAVRGWTAAEYLDWLIVDAWKDEPAWKSATIEDLEKDGGLFDARYDAHRVTSSRRREFQTTAVKAQAAAMADACPPGWCAGDAACEKLCEERTACRAACPKPVNPAAAPPAPPAAASPPGDAAPTREKCLDDCTASFVSKRYRLDSKVHSVCLLEDGPGSVHAQVAGAFAWATSHKVPGTPTIYAGNPSIGFRELGDSDNLSGALVLLRGVLADARAKLRSAPAGTAAMGNGR